MPDFLYRVYIRALAMFRPVTLFHRINRLPWYRDTLREWTDGLANRPGDTLLEVGCATGLLSQHLAGLGLEVTSVDRSRAMIHRANAGRITGVIFQQADILGLPYHVAKFDCVIAASVINVVSEPSAAINEMVRVCKEGGQVSVLVPSLAFNEARFTQLMEARSLSGFSRAALLMWHKMATKMDGRQVAELFRLAGLADVKITEYLDGMVIAVTGSKTAEAV